MWYELAADAIAVTHLCFLVFVVFGAMVGRRNLGWRIAHIAAMTYGVLIEVFYWPCPLTLVEQSLRRMVGRGFYEEPFIAHYLNKIIYVEINQYALIGAAVGVLAANLGIYLYGWREPGNPRQ